MSKFRKLTEHDLTELQVGLEEAIRDKQSALKEFEYNVIKEQRIRDILKHNE